MGEARMARMMSRIEVSKPPGVSICSTTMRLPFARAASRALVTYLEVAGPIAPLISRTVAVAAGDAAAVVGDAAVAVALSACAMPGAFAARSKRGISATVAIMTIIANAARVTLTRTRERAEQAFTLLTLLPSYAGRSWCQSSYFR